MCASVRCVLDNASAISANHAEILPSVRDATLCVGLASPTPSPAPLPEPSPEPSPKPPALSAADSPATYSLFDSLFFASGMGPAKSPKKSVRGSTKSSKGRTATMAAKGKGSPRESPTGPGAAVKDGLGKLGAGARKVADKGEKAVEGVGNVARKLVGYREKDPGAKATTGGESDARESNASVAAPTAASDSAAATPAASTATGAEQRSCGAVYPTEAVPLAQQATTARLHAWPTRTACNADRFMAHIPASTPRYPPPLIPTGGGLGR